MELAAYSQSRRLRHKLLISKWPPPKGSLEPGPAHGLHHPPVLGEMCGQGAECQDHIRAGAPGRQLWGKGSLSKSWHGQARGGVVARMPPAPATFLKFSCYKKQFLGYITGFIASLGPNHKL